MYTDKVDEDWCDNTNRTLPSDLIQDGNTAFTPSDISQPEVFTESGEEESDVSGENRTNTENDENTKDDNNNSGAIATVPAFILLISVVILAGLLQ